MFKLGFQFAHALAQYFRPKHIQADFAPSHHRYFAERPEITTVVAKGAGPQLVAHRVAELFGFLRSDCGNLHIGHIDPAS